MQADMQAPQDAVMHYAGFHFAQPLWFAGLVFIPVMLLLYRTVRRHAASMAELEKFADRHLLPHLLKNRGADERPLRRALALWSAAFLLGLAAMAGPRWNYEDVKTFRPEQDLVILLDLSPAMNVQDVKPSRIARARQEIGDILQMNRGINIGLVAYAGVPHMIAPLTDDMRTLGNLLPSIDTSLATIAGGNLRAAMEMAASMLGGEKGRDKSILIVSDGNFDGNDLPALAAAAGGAAIYTLGVGTAGGAPLSYNGEWLKDRDGKMLLSRLREDRLKTLSTLGHGAYIEATYADEDTKTLLKAIGSDADAGSSGKETRVWEERFYIPALILACLALPWFRKGYVFPALVFAVLFSASVHPARADALDLFRNRAEQGLHAYRQGDYARAATLFDTPYRRGVAQYKARQFDKAEQSFAQSAGPDADYNRGNAQLMQNKPEDAIASYESALKQRPGDRSIEHNLEIAKKLAEQKKQQEQKKQEQKSGQNQNDQNQKGQESQNQNQNGTQKQGRAQGDQDKKSGEGQNAPAKPDDAQKQPDEKQSDGKQPGDKPSGDKPETTQPEQKSPGQKQQEQAGQNQDGQKPEQPAQQQKQPDAPPQPPESTAQGEKPEDKNNAGTNSPRQGPGETGQGTEKPEDAQKQKDAKPRRSQRDLDADQWLGRVQNDPATFLRNQFMIEDRRSRSYGDGDR